MPRGNKNPSPKTRFVKGGPSANPRGRTPNPAIKALRKLTLETYREVIELAMVGNLAALESVAKDPATSAVQVGVAVALLKAIKSGNVEVLERLAERIIGKIPTVIDVNNNQQSAIQVMLTMPSNGREAMPVNQVNPPAVPESTIEAKEEEGP